MYKTILENFPYNFGQDKTKTSNNGAETYIEPFGGSGAILFRKKPSPIEIYNDIECNVYSFFKVISQPKLFREFYNLCSLTIFSRKILNEFKEDLKKNNLTIVERAFRFYYINRVAYNGIGSFSCNVNSIRRGMSKTISDMLSSIDKMPEIHSRLRTVIIENKDGLSFLKKYDKPKVFFYLDPPYHHSTRGCTRYDKDMTDEQQEELIDNLSNIKNAKILLSGYNCTLYNKLLDDGWFRYDFDVKMHTGSRNSKVKTESLWRNYELTLCEAQAVGV